MSLKANPLAGGQPSQGLDLVQIRWQQIRETEFYQKVQTENIDLKQEVIKLEKLLKAQANAPPAQTSNPLHQKLLRTLIVSVKSNNKYMQKELDKIREEVSKQMSFCLSTTHLFFSCNKKYSEMNQKLEQKCLQLNNEKQQLAQTVTDLQQQILNHETNQSNETILLQQKLEKATKERNEYKAKFFDQGEIIVNLTEEVSILKKEKEEFSSTVQVRVFLLS
jgi:hypothetical protein